MHHPTDRIAHTTAFVTPIVEHWLEREIAQFLEKRFNLKDILLWYHPQECPFRETCRSLDVITQTIATGLRSSVATRLEGTGFESRYIT